MSTPFESYKPIQKTLSIIHVYSLHLRKRSITYQIWYIIHYISYIVHLAL